MTVYDPNQPLGRSGTYVASSSPTNDDQWHHIIGTYDNSYLRIYIDGVFENEIAFDKRFDSPSSDLFIGSIWYAYNDGHEGRQWHTFNGVIDEVRIYKRVLSKPEIKALSL